MRNILSCSSYLAKLLLEYVDDRYLIRYVREFLAETLGTFALVLFGDGAVAQVKRPNILLIFFVFTSPTNTIMFLGRSWQGGKERRFLWRFPQHMSGIWLRLDDWDAHGVGVEHSVHRSHHAIGGHRVWG